MNAESVKKFDITVIDNIPEGTTTEHTISATHVEIVDGNLCFYDGAIGGGFLKKRKLVAAYAAGVWLSFEEYEDESDLEWQPVEIDAAEWEQAIRESAERTRQAFRNINPNLGKDGSIGG